MPSLEDYSAAMRKGDVDRCIAIEVLHGVYGYPPELVSVALAAADKGEDVDAAVEAYICSYRPA